MCALVTGVQTCALPILVAHLRSPLVPAVHMNTRHIVTTKAWFGGGADLNPMDPVEQDPADFHAALKDDCDRHAADFCPRFKQWCRSEERRVGKECARQSRTRWAPDT